MDTATLTCLGTGDGHPSADRNHSAFLYRLGGVTLLVDCGEPATRQLRAHGVGADDIDRILITHLHCDHIGGIFMLMQGFWLLGRKKPLTIHLPAEGEAPVRQMLNASYIFPELLAFATDWQPWQCATPITGDGLTFTPHYSTHLEGLRAAHGAKHPQKFEAFGIVIEGAGKRIAHSGDIGGLHDLHPLVAQPLDLLLCEVAHCEPAQLFQFLADKPIKQIAFTHVGGKWRERRAELIGLAQSQLGKIPFTFVEDNQRLTI